LQPSDARIDNDNMKGTMLARRSQRARMRANATRLASTRRPLRLLLAFAMLAIGLAACARNIDEHDAVHILTADAEVNPVLEGYIDRGIDEAEDTDARAVVIKLDTPGGLVSSMEEIVQRIQSSEVPVIVYVSPSGGKAASAGTFITMSAHVAAMAPGTRIGAAHPVGAGGGDIEGDLGDKVENDAAAFARSIAEERGRNAEWAEDAVRDSVSASTEEAVSLGVVDFAADDLDHLLEQAEGRTVKLGANDEFVITGVANAERVSNDMTFFERVLLVLSDPNIAFLLLSLGGLGLLIELFVPGIGLPGIGGTIALILAFFALGTLPVNWAGVALILLAFGLFAAEAFAPGIGVFGVGGAVSLILGGLLMTTSDQPEYEVNRWLLYGMGIVLAMFFVSVATAIIRMRRASPPAGAAALVGETATARSHLNPDGYIFLRGERWKAIAEDWPVNEGERVEVTGVKGLTLRVKRLTDPRGLRNLVGR
jgi:membrane-bound serine protease (ClpP class)